MTALSDIELEAMLDDVESDRVERKQSWAGDVPAKARQAVCAFANDLPNHDKPGVIFIGVTDDGTPTGLDISDQLMLTAADIKTDGKILPPPTMQVHKRTLKGVPVLVVTVSPADAPPVRYEGRIWIRIGPRRGIASAQDERILNEKRRYKDRSYDMRPVTDCSVEDLNRVQFEAEYLPQAVAPDVLEANGRTYLERLSSLGLIVSVDDPTPTLVGLLTLGKTPRSWINCAYVQFLRIRGTDWGGPIVDEQEIDGSLDTIMRRLDDKVRATLANAVDFSSGTLREVRRSPYPLSAIQQVVRNAVMHRTYEGTNAPIRFYWFDDRIEVHSPGGPYGIVTRDNFGRPGISDYRNPGIASVLKNMGFVQRFGFGIAETRRSLEVNGNPPVEFLIEENTVLVTMRASR